MLSSFCSLSFDFFLRSSSNLTSQPPILGLLTPNVSTSEATSSSWSMGLSKAHDGNQIGGRQRNDSRQKKQETEF